MANQSPDRRKVLELLGKVTLLSQFPGFQRWARGLEGAPAPFSADRLAPYQPLFFTAAEFETADQLAELIIPKGKTPGAQEAGVAEFIDFMTAHDPELQYPFRTGLAWLDAFAIRNNGSRFYALQAAERNTLLRNLAYKKEQSVNNRQGHEFFALFRKWTVIGYYTSRVGLEELDYPGLRIYGASPECRHKDNPEHLNLGVPA